MQLVWQEALELFRSLQLPLLETTALLLESGAYLGQDFERSQKLGKMPCWPNNVTLVIGGEMEA